MNSWRLSEYVEIYLLEQVHQSNEGVREPAKRVEKRKEESYSQKYKAI